MFIQANIGTILTIVIAGITFRFFPNTSHIPIIYLLALCYVDIWLFKIFFEFQRITLTLSRIAKANHSELSITELQLLMSHGLIAVSLPLKSFLTGFIIGYLLINSTLLLILFLVFEYLLSILIPTYIPYGYFFKLIGREINNRILGNTKEYIEKTRLEKYFEEIPHTSEYEKAAIGIYGDELLAIK